MSGPLSLYDILGVDRNASKEMIKKAYRKRSLETHPDRGGDAEEFKRVNKAQEVLLDDRRRAIYDQTGQAEDEVGGPGPGAGGGFPFGGGPGGFPFPFPFDIGGMFGGGGPFGGGGVPRGRGPKLPKGPPKIHEMALSLADFYHGKRVHMQFERQTFCTSCKGDGCERWEPCGPCGGTGTQQRIVQMGPMQAISQGPCGQCNGEGRRPVGVCQGCRGAKVSTQKKSLDVSIEPGMRAGEKIVFPRECSDTHEYTEPGDVHIVLQEADEDIELRRAGDDLVTTAQLTFTEAILGCTRLVRGHPAHKEGLTVTIGQGVQHGDTVAIAGEGMPRRGLGGHGNLLVRIEVKVSEKERELLTTNRDALVAIFTSERSS